MALNMFGVTVNDAHMAQVHVADTMLVAVRDLAAICGPTEYRAQDLDDGSIARHTEVIGAYVARGPILPAPVGVVFRSDEHVQRWLQLHYSALTEALSFVENRSAARVHISRAPGTEAVIAGVDVDAVAADALRALRRAAVATLPLRTERAPGLVLSAAFLVEQELWEKFVAAVEEQSKAGTGVHYHLTGPWPPYDFVQMQLGA
ncbi:MAG: GvpL/GvpF family gas vesicle protein [bacterium]